MNDADAVFRPGNAGFSSRVHIPGRSAAAYLNVRGIPLEQKSMRGGSYGQRAC